MRVSGGRFKDRRIESLKVPALRPAMEKVREAVFSSLKARGLLDDARVLDLFAGTGSMIIEAVSRGASGGVAVERSPQIHRLLKANLAELGLTEVVEAVRAEVISYLKTRGHRESFDICFIDPPYGYEHWEEVVLSVKAPVLVVEYHVRDGVELENLGLRVFKRLQAGQTVVSMASRRHL